jgi:hypothetical protein
VGSLSSRLPTVVWCGSHLACVLPVTAAIDRARFDWTTRDHVQMWVKIRLPYAKILRAAAAG